MYVIPHWASNYVKPHSVQLCLERHHTALTSYPNGPTIMGSTQQATAKSSTMHRPDISARRLHGDLTPRENQVLILLIQGLTNKLIADRLSLSEHSVKFHMNGILAKLGAANRTEAVSIAMRRGLTQTNDTTTKENAMPYEPKPNDIENLKAIRRAINKTAYHGGLGLHESGRFLGTMDTLLATFGVGPDERPTRPSGSIQEQLNAFIAAARFGASQQSDTTLCISPELANEVLNYISGANHKPVTVDADVEFCVSCGKRGHNANDHDVADFAADNPPHCARRARMSRPRPPHVRRSDWRRRHRGIAMKHIIKWQETREFIAEVDLDEAATYPGRATRPDHRSLDTRVALELIKHRCPNTTMERWVAFKKRILLIEPLKAKRATKPKRRKRSK
jgi:DNA-binding CsgD family transcriptional regulator